ncbi:MAG TPA: DUF5752 family protein [Vicinamibacteria bacterium]|nr:DUF5752 family protein [Vicinamibacteria bacterium]
MAAPPPIAPFEFRRVAFLVEVTPLRAGSLAQFLTSLTLAPEPSLFYHLHRRFFREPEALPEFGNDFATWAATALGDGLLAERLANVNLARSGTLAGVRQEMSVLVAERIEQIGGGRAVLAGFEFAFCRARMVEFGTGLVARAPSELVEHLREVDIDSVAFHLFSRRAASAQRNDFADWVRRSGLETLARQLEAFDPYLNSLEDNRGYLIELIQVGLSAPDAAGSP